MKILGLSEGFHDAGACLIEDGEIVSATHSERLSRVKNDRWLHQSQLVPADIIAFYEKPWLKKMRQWIFNTSTSPRNTYYDVSFSHHKSHAAAGFYTSQFSRCNILVVDSVGEWDTISIWDAWMDGDTPKMKKKTSWKFPFSLGLLYSAVTQRIGLKPNEDEYITMGMAAYGEPIYDLSDIMYENNIRGIGSYRPEASNEDLAASVQRVLETFVLDLIDRHCPEFNLVFMGGVALNCVLNSKISAKKNVWIMPNPGDCGSSLGAAALAYGKKLNWKDPYLGTSIGRAINPKRIVDHLLEFGYCGIANGRAEFGPRALGNRSLIADPRLDIKDTINDIKQRQRFRPFAPAILSEYKDQYFDGPMNQYMQFVAKAKHDYSSVTHVDGTARVQVVTPKCNTVLRPILEEWYDRTGCPMLLNTSLNIKGQPIVDSWSDADQFMKHYKVMVF